MRKGIMALEGLEQEEVIVADEAPATDFVDVPENDTLEMNEAQAEIDEVDDGITEAAETAETLEVIQDSLGESAAEGGMSEPEAKAVEVAVEHLCARLGFSSTKRIMPAMENFADKTTRIRATMEAMENVKAKLKSIWDAIVNALTSAVEWVQKYWAHLIDATKKYGARAQQLVKAATPLKSGALKDDKSKTVSASGFGKALSVDGKVLEGEAFASKYTAFSGKSGAEASVSSELTFAEGFSGDVNSMIAGIKDKAAFDKALEAAVGSMKKLGGEVTKNKDAGNDGVEVRETALAFGGVSKYTTVVADAAKAAANFSKVSVKVGPSTGAKALEAAGEVAGLTPEQVVTVASAAQKHMAGYANFQATVNKIKKIQSDVLAAANKAKAGFGTLDKSEEKVNSQTAAAAAKSIVSITTSGMAAIQSYDVAVTKAALDYCGASLKLYGHGDNGSIKATEGSAGGLPAPADKAAK